MPAIELRRLRDPDDAAACDELFAEYGRWIVEQLGVVHGLVLTEQQFERVHTAFRDDRHKVFGARGRLYLAEVDGATAGVSALRPVSATEAEVKRVYVRPAYRGLGLGRRLLGRLLDDARELGFATVRLESLDFMAEAHGLYRAFGFADTERFPGFEGVGHGVEPYEVFMRLTL